MKKNQQKIWLLVAAIVVVVIAGVLIAKSLGKKDTTSTATTEETIVKKKKISAPINVIDMNERPVVALKPYTQTGGRFVSIEVSDLRKSATAAEYEIVYNVIGASAVSASGAKIKVPDSEAQEGQQGFMGELDLTKLPTKTENRFGTCSAGGACINNNVSGGSLTLTFDGEAKYAVMSNWTYFEDGKEISGTEDGAFQMEAAALADNGDYLIAEAMGLPNDLPGTAAMISDGGKDGGNKPVAYQINFTTAPKTNEALVTFAEYKEAKVAVWDNKSWKTYNQDEVMPLGDGYIYVVLANV